MTFQSFAAEDRATPVGAWPLAAPPNPSLEEPEGQIAEARSWTCIQAATRTVRCDGAYRRDILSTKPCLMAVLEEVGGQVRISLDGRGGSIRANRSEPPLGVIPGGATASVTSDCITLVRDLAVDFDVPAIEAAFDRPVEATKLFAPREMVFDRDLRTLCGLLAGECAASGPMDRLYGDSLAMALVVVLARLEASEAQSGHRGGLAPWQLRRAIDCIQTHLVNGVDLATLAAVTQLSTHHFVRAFKVSTGTTPHGWLRQARVDRAKTLILDRRWALAQVAAETGFADQAHLTRVFRKVTGESPGAWRRDRAGRLS